MLKIVTILLTLTTLWACGQQTPGPYEKFNSKFVRVIGDTNTLMLIQDVKVTYGDIYVESDSLLFEKNKQSITAYGIQTLRFKGEAVRKENYSAIIRYKLGDPKFYQ